MIWAVLRLEDDSNADATSTKRPGQIEIVLQTSKRPETRREHDAPDPFVVPAHDKVYEGSSKGMAHQVKLVFKPVVVYTSELTSLMPTRYSEPREDRLASPRKLFNLKNPFTIAKHAIKYRPLGIQVSLLLTLWFE